jgi:hypothetical protein
LQIDIVMKSVKIFILILFSGIIILNQSETIATTIHRWEVLTIAFKSQNDYANPYFDIPVNTDEDLLKVIFTGNSGEARGKQYSLVAFWNGGKEWKVNFAAPLGPMLLEEIMSVTGLIPQPVKSMIHKLLKEKNLSGFIVPKCILV